MSSIRAFVRTEKKATNKTSKIRFRVRDGEGVDLYLTSNIEVYHEQWDNKKECIKAKVVISPDLRNEIDTSVREYKNVISSAYKKLVAAKDEVSSKVLLSYIDRIQHPEKYLNINGEECIKEQLSFFELFDKEVSSSKSSEGRRKNYLALRHHLQCFELYKQKSNKLFKFDIHTFSTDMLNDFEKYLFNDVAIYDKYPDIFLRFSNKKPLQKGQNTITELLEKLSVFFNWLIKNEYILISPFKKFSYKALIFGTPYYITIAERNKLYNHNFTDEDLAHQRDIFVFQCCIGCRRGDLYLFTRKNIIDGAVEYIAAKTMEGIPRTVRVPLNKIAREILDKYEHLETTDGRLFNFDTIDNYNYFIRKMFKEAGINRMITKLNPKTRISEQHPLYDVATSHMARRTFIGNLYKKVKDPNLIGSMSGHVEGSKAFARYREIDEEIKIDLVKMLE